MGSDRQPGDKLLPKIMQAVIGSVIATKTGLTGHEFDLKVNVGQELIDRMGNEAAELGRPFIRAALDNPSANPHKVARDFLESAASGKDQIKAIGGILTGGAQATIGQALSNVLAPVLYEINRHDPNLTVDPSTAAAGWAAGLISSQDAMSGIANFGYSSGPAELMMDLAQSIPSPPDLAQAVLRGYIDPITANGWLKRNGYPDTIVDMYESLRNSILSVQDASLAVLRGDITREQGLIIAFENGYNTEDFDVFLANTGEPPGAQELSEALRRGFISEATFKRGILQSRVRDEWIPTLLALRYSPINTADAVNAYVEGYVDEDTVKSVADQNGLEPGQYKILTEAAGDPLSYTDMMRLWRYNKATEDDVKAALRRGRLKDNYIDFALALKDSPMSVPDAIEASIQGYLSADDAKAIALMNGLREQDFEPLLKTAGDPASRTEMIELWRRNEVTQQDVENALRQSRLKDSYIADVLKLKVQLPALYEVRALLASGGLSAEQGTQILLAQGYSADVVKGIVSNAVGQTTAAHKALTEAMYADLYQDGSITAEEFRSALVTLGYSDVDSELIEAVYDNKLALSQRNSVIAAIKKGYVSHRIDEPTAQSELNQLGIPSNMVDRLIADWDIVISTDIKLLSAAQVVDAWQIQLFNDGDEADNTTQALNYLVKLGYSASDAILLLEIKIKGPLPNDQASGKVPTSAPNGGTPQATGS